MELLRDRSAEFEQAGVRVMAASRDSPWSHVAWMQALDLNFPLLSDWNGDAIRAFGIGRLYRGMKDVAQRPPADALAALASGSSARPWSQSAARSVQLPARDRAQAQLCRVAVRSPV